MTKTRVLIVDDEPNIRDLLATSLRFAGFEIQTAANGTAAVAAVTESEPDIILLDVMLPDMNGFSVTKKLRSAGIQAPILFLTACDEVEDKITGLTVGGDDYLTKPFSLDEVVARIQAILRRKPRFLITFGSMTSTATWELLNLMFPTCAKKLIRLVQGR